MLQQLMDNDPFASLIIMTFPAFVERIYVHPRTSLSIVIMRRVLYNAHRVCRLVASGTHGHSRAAYYKAVYPLTVSISLLLGTYEADIALTQIAEAERTRRSSCEYENRPDYCRFR